MADTNRPCDICGSTRDVSLLPTGNLCAVCDSLGRLYAARNAYQEAQYRRAVEIGAQGSLTVAMRSGEPSWSANTKTSGAPVTFRQLANDDTEDEDRRMPPFGPRA